jgi:hypothetical protein
VVKSKNKACFYLLDCTVGMVSNLYAVSQLFASLASERSGVVPRPAPVQCVIKGKAVLLQAWTGPEGSRRLKLPDFKTIGT